MNNSPQPLKMARMREKGSFFDIKKLLTALFAFCVVFCSQDTLLFGTFSKSWVKYSRLGIYALALFAMGIYLFFTKQGRELLKRPGRRNFYICFGVFLILILLPLLVFWDFGPYTHMYLQVALLVTLFAFASELFSFKEVFRYSSYLVILISLISNILFAVTIVFGTNVLRFLPKIENERGYELYFALLTNVPLLGHRNYGIFREPGVYSIYLCSALAFLIFNFDFSDKKRTIAFFVSAASLVVSLLSTRSTTGYFCLILVLVASIFRRFPNERFRWIWIGGLAASALVGAIVGIRNFSEIFGKLFTANESLSSRAYAPVYNLTLFLRSPLVGNGANKYIVLFGEATYLGNPISNTDTFIGFLASYGLFVGLIFFGGFYQGCLEMVDSSKTVNKLPFILVFLTMLILFETENVAFSTLFHLVSVFPLRDLFAKARKRVLVPTRYRI